MRHKKTQRIKNKKRTKNFKKYGGYGLKTKSKKHKHKHSNKHTNSIKFVKLNCSPENHNKALNSFTCYSDEDLHKLRDIWNARHPDRPIQTNDSKQIWETIKNHYQTTCNKESCWIKQMAKGTRLEKELMDSFAPESPDDWK